MAWTVLKRGEPYSEFGGYHIDYMIDAETDITTPPQEYAAPGSTAMLPDLSAIFIKGADGDWHKAE